MKLRRLRPRTEHETQELQRECCGRWRVYRCNVALAHELERDLACDAVAPLGVELIDREIECVSLDLRAVRDALWQRLVRGRFEVVVFCERRRNSVCWQRWA